jgi:hypothetical protein
MLAGPWGRRSYLQSNLWDSMLNKTLDKGMNARVDG